MNIDSMHAVFEIAWLLSGGVIRRQRNSVFLKTFLYHTIIGKFSDFTLMFLKGWI